MLRKRPLLESRIPPALAVGVCQKQLLCSINIAERCYWYDQQYTRLLEAYRIAVKQQHLHLRAEMSYKLCILLVDLGNLKLANMYAKQVFLCARQQADLNLESRALWCLAWISLYQGKLDDSQVLYTLAIKHARQLDKWGNMRAWKEKRRRQMLRIARFQVLQTPNYKATLPTKEDRDYWHAFWEPHMPDSWMTGPGLTDSLFEIIPALQQRGCRKILFAGNGISLEPRVFAQVGFDVTALDLCQHAIDMSQSIELTPKKVRRFTYFKNQADIAIDQERDQAVQFVCGSLFDPQVCAETFDCIVIRNTLQYFYGANLTEALDAFFARLAPNGVLIVYTHNAYHHHEHMYILLQAWGLAVSEIPQLAAVLAANPDQQVVWLRASSG